MDLLNPTLLNGVVQAVVLVMVCKVHRYFHRVVGDILNLRWKWKVHVIVEHHSAPYHTHALVSHYYYIIDTTPPTSIN